MLAAVWHGLLNSRNSEAATNCLYNCYTEVVARLSPTVASYHMMYRSEPPMMPDYTFAITWLWQFGLTRPRDMCAVSCSWRGLDRYRYIYLYSAYKSEDSLGAWVAKEMCFQRSSEGIEEKSRPPQSGWKIVRHSRGPAAEKLLSPNLLVPLWTQKCNNQLDGYWTAVVNKAYVVCLSSSLADNRPTWYQYRSIIGLLLLLLFRKCQHRRVS